MIREMFHTQEKRTKQLKEAVACVRNDAWLGVARYFWLDIEDAKFWGITSKKNTGWYEVYSAEIDCEDVLDTVFSEEQYNFWIRQIKKAEAAFKSKTKVRPTLKDLNDYFLDHGIWSKFGGIMFQDIANNEWHYIVKGFQYRKRIQLAVYKPDIISNFAHHFTDSVTN